MYEVKHHIKVTKAEFFIIEPELLDAVLSFPWRGIPTDRIFVFNVRRQPVLQKLWFLVWVFDLKKGRLDPIQ